MSALEGVLRDPAVGRLGLALAHFLWQGAALAGLVAVALACLRKATADARYLVLLVALALMVACPVATFVVLRAPAAEFAAPATPRPNPPPADLPASPKAALAPPAVTAPEPAPAAAPRASVTQLLPPLRALAPWAVLLWAAGVLLLSLRLMGKWHAIARAQRRAAQGAGDRWRQMVAGLSTRLDLRHPVRVLESAAVYVPSVLGWLRPVILLPTTALTGLTPEQWRAILAHELAHVRRNDYLANLAQMAVETLLFYHPAAWWLSGRIRAEREHCCDDLAVAACGDAAVYMSALAELEHLRLTPEPALGASSGSLLRRMRRLAGVSPSRPGHLPAWLAGAATLAVLAVMTIGLHAARAAEGKTATKGVVIRSGLEISDTPQASASHIAQAHAGDMVQVLETDETGWLRVRLGTKVGWVRGEGLVGLAAPGADGRLLTAARDQEERDDLAALALYSRHREVLPHSPSAALALYRYGQVADRLAGQATREAQAEFRQAREVSDTSYLEWRGLDKFRPWGLTFRWSHLGGNYYYAGGVYRTVLQQYATSEWADDATYELLKRERVEAGEWEGFPDGPRLELEHWQAFDNAYPESELMPKVLLEMVYLHRALYEIYSAQKGQIDRQQAAVHRASALELAARVQRDFPGTVYVAEAGKDIAELKSGARVYIGGDRRPGPTPRDGEAAAAAPGNTDWGPVCEGFQLRAELRKPVVSVHEAVYLRLTLRNVTEQPLFMWESYPEHDFDLTVDRVTREPVTPVRRRDLGVSRRVTYRLQPDEEMVFEYSVNWVYGWLAPGSYDLGARFRVRKLSGEGFADVSSNRVSLTVAKDAGESGAAAPPLPGSVGRPPVIRKVPRADRRPRTHPRRADLLLSTPPILVAGEWYVPARESCRWLRASVTVPPDRSKLTVQWRGQSHAWTRESGRLVIQGGVAYLSIMDLGRAFGEPVDLRADGRVWDFGMPGPGHVYTALPVGWRKPTPPKGLSPAELSVWRRLVRPDPSSGLLCEPSRLRIVGRWAAAKIHPLNAITDDAEVILDGRWGAWRIVAMGTEPAAKRLGIPADVRRKLGVWEGP